jgi:hypothetical protein
MGPTSNTRLRLSDCLWHASAGCTGALQLFGCHPAQVTKWPHGFLFVRSVRQPSNIPKLATLEWPVCTIPQNRLSRRLVTNASAQIAGTVLSTCEPTSCTGLKSPRNLGVWINSFGHSLNEQDCRNASQAGVNIFEVGSGYLKTTKQG